jgi:hypothetical protein
MTTTEYSMREVMETLALAIDRQMNAVVDSRVSEQINEGLEEQIQRVLESEEVVTADEFDDKADSWAYDHDLDATEFVKTEDLSSEIYDAMRDGDYVTESGIDDLIAGWVRSQADSFPEFGNRCGLGEADQDVIWQCVVDLVKNPTQEFTEALNDVVVDAAAAVQPPAPETAPDRIAHETPLSPTLVVAPADTHLWVLKPNGAVDWVGWRCTPL